MPKESKSNNPYKHPPHLKGKAIGLWYSQRSKERKSKEDKEKGFQVSKVIIILIIFITCFILLEIDI